MIDSEVKKLGEALLEIHRKYDATEIGKILDYAFEHKSLSGYPNDLAAVLEQFASKLRALAKEDADRLSKTY